MKQAAVLDKWMRWPLVVALGVAWSAMSWVEYRSMLVEEIGVDENIVERYYDRELRLLEAADRAGPYGKWIAGAEDTRTLLEETAEIIDSKYLAELGEDGQELLEVISLKLGEIAETQEIFSDDDYRVEMRSWLLEGYGDAWDYELFLQATEDPAVRSFYTAQNDRLMFRAVAMSAVFDGLFLVGLLCAIYLLFGKKHVANPPSHFPDRWSARALLGGFFTLNLLIYPWIFTLGILYQIWILIVPEHLAYLIFDLAWRAFPAAVLVLLFLKTPRNAWRVFGLGKPIVWTLLVAVAGVTFLVDIAIFQLAPPGEIDPTDFMETADTDLPTMLSLLFSSVVVAPVFEEIVFRGFLFQGLRSKIGNLGAGVVSTVLFALVHVRYDIWGWISVGAMGAGAAYLTLRTSSLKSAIIFHATINLLVTANVYYQYQLPL